MANEIKPIGATDISAMGTVVGNLMTDLRQIIDEARIHVASTANYELTMMYWHIGDRINRDVLGNERATYGKQIIATVSRQLQAWYGSKGFEERTIRRMVQFAQEFPDWQIVSPLVSKLSWTHFLTIMTLKDPLQREFYLTMAANERWSKRTLQSKIDGMLYERTALSSKPEEVVYGKGVLKRVSERLTERLGKGWSEENLRLMRKFYTLYSHVQSPIFKIQTSGLEIQTPKMYVNYYDRYVKEDFEKPTIGILLCERKNDALVELTLPKDANIYAQQYALCLPDKALLQQKLREWIAEFKEKEDEA